MITGALVKFNVLPSFKKILICSRRGSFFACFLLNAPRRFETFFESLSSSEGVSGAETVEIKAALSFIKSAKYSLAETPVKCSSAE